MTKDETAIYNLLSKAGGLRAVQIHQTLKMGFHRLYPALHQLRKHDFIEGIKEGSILTYQVTGKAPE